MSFEMDCDSGILADFGREDDDDAARPRSRWYSSEHSLEDALQEQTSKILSAAALAIKGHQARFIAQYQMQFQAKLRDMAQDFGAEFRDSHGESGKSFEIAIGVDGLNEVQKTRELVQSESQRSGGIPSPMTGDVEQANNWTNMLDKLRHRSSLDSTAPSGTEGISSGTMRSGSRSKSAAFSVTPAGSTLPRILSNTAADNMEILDNITVVESKAPDLETGFSRPAMSHTVSVTPDMGIARPGRRTHIFHLLPEWCDNQEELNDLDKTQLAQQLAAYYQDLRKQSRKFDISTEAQALHYRGAPCILHPGGRVHILWDLLAGIFLAYDLYMIPLGAFNLPEDGFVFIMSVIVMLYWTGDILLSFIMGYYLPDGEIEMRFQRIAHHYLKSWFLVDCGIVGVDWVTIGPKLLTGNSSAGADAGSAGLVRLGKVSRIVRLLRLVRLVRIRKLLQFFETIRNWIGMESSAIIMSICKNLLQIILMNHCLASLWFYIGMLHEEVGWLRERKSPNWWDNYFMSLHWSIANFTPGSSGIQPVTTEEYAFHICVLYFALVVFSVFVSSTTSLITKLMGLQSSQSKKLWILKGFLIQHHFPPEFRDRVLRYVKAAIGARRDLIKRSDVELLEVLSKPLREEVQASLQLATIKAHPLLKLLAVAGPALLRQLSTEAVSEVPYSRGDVIFTLGEGIDKMGFVVIGVLSYRAFQRGDGVDFANSVANSVANSGVASDASTPVCSPGREDPKRSSPNGIPPAGNRHPFEDSMSIHEGNFVLLGAQDFYCEAPLWTKWHTRGTLQADADCDILEISGPAFRKSVLCHHIMTDFVRQYAVAFIEVLNIALTGGMSEPLTDLQANFVAEGDAIQRVLMEPNLHQRVSSGIMKGFTSSGQRSPTTTERMFY